MEGRVLRPTSVNARPVLPESEQVLKTTPQTPAPPSPREQVTQADLRDASVPWRPQERTSFFSAWGQGRVPSMVPSVR